ncbi:MAG: histidine--tRNA ligase [Pyrinomonadaceae bacterium]
MANTNPARGMRDFLPVDVRKREYVIGIIKEVYESYGFEPLETPAVENLETLMGKYGEEGNQLIFKILKRGEKLQEELNAGEIKSENELSDSALRYDLTVPLARVVANHKNDLPKFFKRYQIQPVWRADRPARGRFREFYQCDVDAIGSNSMIVEAELCAAVSEILIRLGFEDFMIRLNHRKILTGILETSGIKKDLHTDALIILDKRDKISAEEFVKEFERKDIPLEGVHKWLALVNSINKKRNDNLSEQILRESNQDIVETLSDFLKNHEEGLEGLDDLIAIWNLSEEISDEPHIGFELLLARGLSYYTGAIMEIDLRSGDFNVSLGGGGRYDGLIGMFGKEQIPACGFSLGLERILVVMEERGMFQKLVDEGKLKLDSADVLITIWNEESIGESLKLANELRKENLRVLVYPEADKLGKQFKYADSIKIPFVCVLGESEIAENKVTLKNLRTGEQEIVSREEIAAKVAGGNLL